MPQRVHLKIVKLGDPMPISDMLPMLENFGLRVIAERPYELAWPEGGSAWIQDFELEQRDCQRVDIAALEALFKEAFLAAWRGEIENDGFNRLLLRAPDSRARDRRAARLLPLPAADRRAVQPGVHGTHARRATPRSRRTLVRLFETQFDPGAQRAARAARAAAARAAIRAALDAVTSLDEDRILRGYLNVIRATLRTNYYQTGRRRAGRRATCPSSSIRSKMPDLPLPRPKFEIFVYSPRVEGVHLRMGYVARGGLRWSDRREDFRTEVLGLMKAQNVKNTRDRAGGRQGRLRTRSACPPAHPRGGAGRSRRQLPDLHPRPARRHRQHRRAARSCAPPRVVRRDGDDAYLVVAADKGTATFSDIANAISIEYGFWLGDAFASGGSAGYDHKKMGITARGAWECVKRHFREIGIDIQTQDFTVRRHRRHVGRRVRQRHAAVAAHPPAGRLRSPPHLPRSEPRRRRELSRARAPVQAAALELGRLRPQAHLARRRRVPAHRQVHRAVSRGADAARARGRDAPPERNHPRHPAHAGRPAVERRHRHLREGER